MFHQIKSNGQSCGLCSLVFHGFGGALVAVTVLLIGLPSIEIENSTLVSEVTLNGHASEVRVLQTGELMVSERQAIASESPNAQPDIVRVFPSKFSFSENKPSPLEVSVDQAWRGSQPLPFSKRENPKHVAYTIRDSKEDSQSGNRRVFDLQYRVNGAIAETNAYNELWWNANSPFPFQTKSSSIKLRFPLSVPRDLIRFEAYIGYSDGSAPLSPEKSSVIVEGHWNSDALVFISPRPLGAGESLIVHAVWPKGFLSV